MTRLRAPGDVLVHLRRARDHADRHYTEPLELDSLAAVAGLSKFHFQRLFKATYGLSPAAYLSQRRVERAQDLLRATNLTVTEVCHAVGFCSLGSFSSRFREIAGETPSVPAEVRRHRRTVAHPSQPELAVHLAVPGAAALPRDGRRHQPRPRRGRHARPRHERRRLPADLRGPARQGVEFIQPPEGRPYGVEAVARDNSGNWMVLVGSRPYTPEDVAD